MMFGKKTAVSLLALASCLRFGVAAAEGGATAPEDSHVVKLGADNFDSFLKENDLIMAEFYAPWCGHCKNLAPEYIKAAEELVSHNISLAQIDCTENQELCAEHRIQGYPTIKIIKNGNMEKAKDYNSQRSAKGIVEFMIKQSVPTVTVIEDEDALEEILLNATQPVIVDFGVKDFNKTFQVTADDLYADYVFVQFKDPKKSKVSIYMPSEDDSSEPIDFDGKFKDLIENEDKFGQWVIVQSLPYFDEIDGSNYAAYAKTNLPLGYYFYENEKHIEDVTETFEKLAKEFRGKINFVKINAVKYGKHALQLNLKEQFPAFAIFDQSTNLKYAIEQLAEEEFEKVSDKYSIDNKKINKIVKDFVAGKAAPTIKSEPIPETQDSNVYKLVAHTHDEIINDKKKDVLVKYYAPWCGHCKRLAPIYNDLADLLNGDKQTKDKFVIAEIDATENDVASVDLEGYPTLILYPAGKNSEPVTFQQQREVENFLQFLLENAGNKIDSERLLSEYQESSSKKEEKLKDEVNHDEL